MLLRSRPSAWLAVAAALLGGAGCGSTSSVPSNGMMQVALSEYRVTPRDVHAGPGVLTILVHNYGRLTHNLVITLAGHPEGSTKPIGPGQAQELVANLAPGHYLMSSTILSDQALGAYGTLDVGS